MVLGDPGEGDDSQYQVLRPLRATLEGHRLHLHRQRRHLPGRRRRRLPRQVLLAVPRAARARSTPIPGNHDWYDGLHGFMTLLCGADPTCARRCTRARAAGSAPSSTSPGASRRRRSRRRSRRCRPTGPSRSGQPAPVLRDRAEGARARRPRHRHPVGDRRRAGRMAAQDLEAPEGQDPPDRQAARRRRRRKRCPIAGSDDTVNAIVDDPANRYVAVIGGDIHNFQRYPVRSRTGASSSTSSAARRARTRRRRTRSRRRRSTAAAATRTTSAATRAAATRSPPTRSCSTASFRWTSRSRTTSAPAVMSLRLEGRRRPDARRRPRQACPARRLAQGEVRRSPSPDAGIWGRSTRTSPSFSTGTTRPAALQELPARRRAAGRGRDPLLRGHGLRGARRQPAARGPASRAREATTGPGTGRCSLT